jgi:uncharacterized LabA/DUF88 family protein
VTTENTHSEHNDVDATVVEHQHASEIPQEELSSAPTEPETTSGEQQSEEAATTSTAPVEQPLLAVSEAQPTGEAEAQVEISAQEQPAETQPAVEAEVQAEASTQALLEALEQEQLATAVAKEQSEAPTVRQGEHVADSTTQPANQVEATPATPVAQEMTGALPLPAVEQEEIRSFTDFFEEFRQAEARLNASIQLAEQSFDVPNEEQEKGKTATTQFAPLNIEAVVEQLEQKAHEAEKEKEKPVSPLLRPASRTRFPRHGQRHQARESAPVVEEEKKVSEPQAPAVSEPLQEAPATLAATSEEPAQPRPARKYRFDRPSARKTPAPVAPALVRSEESKPAVNQIVPEAPAPVTPPVVEAPAVKQPAAQVENNTPAEHTPHSRRQKQHERIKEQAASPAAVVPPQPVVEAPTPVPEVEEIAPEDLPPLEYADLQKASSSRRRRRHRTGSNGTTPAVAPVVNNVVPAPPVQPTQPPRVPSPTTPPVAPQPVQYSIVSGYTLSQMNQGNDNGTPFMGPDPSPAKGSLIPHTARPPRSEVIRTQATSYPGTPTRSPSHEQGMNAAALNQFANSISQAFQTQTDRMIAEMRRAQQSPTNITVSLPPFPSNERVGVFVDVANLLYSARTLRIGVDFGKLLEFLRGNRRLVRAQAYCPTSPQPGDEQMFLQAVKGLGYRITTKNYKTFSSGAKKADLDLDLCMDVVRLVDGRAVDCIVLVSGDSDFMPMLDYCSDHGVRVEVAAFDEAMSATLRQSCDLFVNLSMLEEIRV